MKAKHLKTFENLNTMNVKTNKFGIINRLFCQHDFYLVNQFEMKSEFDLVVEAGKIPNTWNSQTRKHVTDYKCSICNKIKRLIVKNNY